MRYRAALRTSLACLAAVIPAFGRGEEDGIRSLTATQVAREFDQNSWLREHGLPPGDRVHTITQTSDGYLWAGTQAGLVRFDGRRFTVYDHVNTPELAGNDECRTLTVDDADNLWFGTRDRVICKSGKRFVAISGDFGPHFVEFPALSASRHGGVWVGGRGAVCHVSYWGGVVLAKTYPLKEPETVVSALREDAGGKLWIGSSLGLSRFDPGTGHLARVGASDDTANWVVLDLWLQPEGRLFALIAEFLPVARRPPPRTWVASVDPKNTAENLRLRRETATDRVGSWITGDHQGTLWFAGASGAINRYRDGMLESLPVPRSAAEDISLAIFPDREGNLWVGMDKGGLQRWIPRKFMQFSTADGLAHDNTWSICEARDGSMLIGTDGGVTRIREGEVSTLKSEDGTVHTDVRAVAEDADGAIWVGTMRSLECIVDGKSRRVRLPGAWFEEKIRALLPGRDGSMWIGTALGLTHIRDGERIKYTRTDGLGSDEVRALLETRKGDLWVGTMGGGLSRFQDGRFVGLGMADGLPSMNVWALHEDSEGVLWFGTEDGFGFYREGRIKAFKQADGLPDNLVNFIVSDDLGRIWIGHDRGVYTLMRKDLLRASGSKDFVLSPVLYDESDGLLSSEVNGQKSYPSACKTRNGQLWFPTTHGVAVVDPGKVRLRPAEPLAVIEEVRANGKAAAVDVPAGAVTRKHETQREPDRRLVLAPGAARVLEFHYTANAFVAPEKVRFNYRLVGLDDNWIDAESRHQVTFTDLHPGDYRFELRARNHNGVWQQTSAAVDLHLEPFLYQKWWFWSVCGAMGLAMAGMIIVWRWRELHRIYELRRVSDLNIQRRQIARDIHDELGASLTHILQLSSRLGRSRQGQESPRHAERIATVAGEAVDSIGEIVWANNPEYDTLEDLTAYLREHAASFFAESDIKLHLDFPESVPAKAVVGSVRRHIVLLLKEALQNVVKHARATEVTVRLRLAGKGLEMRVTDNGCGMPAEGGRKYGNGINNMRDRVTQLRGSFELVSPSGGGTEVRVSIPELEF